MSMWLDFMDKMIKCKIVLCTKENHHQQRLTDKLERHLEEIRDCKSIELAKKHIRLYLLPYVPAGIMFHNLCIFSLKHFTKYGRSNLR